MAATQPSVPRDTRLLLAIVLISVALLWVLARIRFPERPPTPNPVPPVLAQLAPPSAFDDIVSTVTRLQPRLAAALAPIDGIGSNGETRRATALRFRGDLALGLLPDDLRVSAGEGMMGPVEVGRDRASHLAVFRLPDSAAATMVSWSPRRADLPRFLMAASAAE